MTEAEVGPETTCVDCGLVQPFVLAVEHSEKTGHGFRIVGGSDRVWTTDKREDEKR